MNNSKSYTFTLSRKYDRSQIEFLDSLPNKQAFMRQLLTEEMKRRGMAVEDAEQPARDIRSMVKTAAFDELSPDALRKIQELIESQMAQPKGE